jgi:hypothetical protein
VSGRSVYIRQQIPSGQRNRCEARMRERTAAEVVKTTGVQSVIPARGHADGVGEFDGRHVGERRAVVYLHASCKLA